METAVARLAENLERGGAAVAVANADRFVDAGDKDLSIPDLSSSG